jgi:hypothetical protein
MQTLSEDRWIIGFLVAVVAWGLFGLPFIFLNWQWLMHDAAGFFTSLLVVVGVFQLGLFAWQLTLIRKSLAPAEKAANAAQRAADVLPIVERAYVFMVPELEFWDPVPHSSGVGTYSSRIGVKFKIENHGKTPAVIESIDARLRVLLEAPDNRLHLIANVMTGEKIIPSGGHWVPDTSPRNCNVSEGDADDMSNRRAAIWFYGSILYKDMFGNERTTRFRWSYSELLEIFTPRGEAPYNERA